MWVANTYMTTWSRVNWFLRLTDDCSLIVTWCSKFTFSQFLSSISAILPPWLSPPRYFRRPVLWIRIRCLFGPGIRNRFIPDPGSQTHIFESLVMTIFCVKSSIILWKLAQKFFLQHSKNKIIFNFVKFKASKKGTTTNFFFIPHCYCCFWIRDPRSGMGKNQDPE